MPVTGPAGTPAGSLLAALLLGLIQGVTEFLPVSSSGHLAAAQLLWPGLAFPGVTAEIALHVGTTLAVFGYYRSEVVALVTPSGGDGPEGLEVRKWWLYLGAGTIPAALLGAGADDFIRSTFESLGWVAAGLVVTGIALMASRFRGEGRRDLDLLAVLAIGVVQAVAIVPGVSRSGLTISAALLLGVRRRQSVVFSFLLSVPAIVGATLLDATLLVTGPRPPEGLFLNLAFATLLAAIVGYICIGLVHRATRGAWWHRFSWYCWALAVAITLAAR